MIAKNVLNGSVCLKLAVAAADVLSDALAGIVVAVVAIDVVVAVAVVVTGVDVVARAHPPLHRCRFWRFRAAWVGWEALAVWDAVLC